MALQSKTILLIPADIPLRSQFFSSMDAPMDALPLRIWRLSLLPYDSAQLQGWGAALVLIIIILASFTMFGEITAFIDKIDHHGWGIFMNFS